MARVEITIPSQAEHVRTARLVTGAAARRAGIDEEEIEELRLAVGEACARAVLRHQNRGSSTPIQIDITEDDQYFEVDVYDSGSGDSGSGDEGIDDQMMLAMIDALVPQSSVQASGSGTVVKMMWPVAAA